MTPQDLFSAFLAGRQLPALTSRTCRQLLDLARNAILSKGKEPRFSTAPPTVDAEKQSLISAGDQLRQLGIADAGAIYAQASTDPLAGKLDEITARAAKLKAAGDAAPFLNAYLESQGATPTRPAKAPKPAAKQDLIADVQREFERAKELAAAADAQRTPTPRTTPARPAPAAARPAQPSPQTKTMPTPAPTSTTSTPSANDRRLAQAILDEQERRDAAALVKTRAELAALSPAQRMAFFKRGGKLTA